ncbi:hypothetical protein DSO57_1025931 [Entomophthora muscae]|uniref:Uncharacterized protein n=1 Tax=Entomophthora muscae TaxID=34485 RepID=A0ACC2TP06_9FUNG|nr:hypothetical protein DSO57_1025931 [Entomophthora muscae]
MHTIGFISAVLHFSLGVDASPIESSASLASIPLDTSLLQRAGQSLVLTGKVPADKGATLSRRAGLITMDEGDQQENTSKGMASLLKDSKGQNRGVLKNTGKQFPKLTEVFAKRIERFAESTGRILNQVNGNKETLGRLLQALLEEENPTPGKPREEIEDHDPKSDAEANGFNKLPATSPEDFHGGSGYNPKMLPKPLK